MATGARYGCRVSPRPWRGAFPSVAVRVVSMPNSSPARTSGLNPLAARPRFSLRDESAQVAVLLFVISLAILVPLTHDCVFMAGNDASRFAQIESLVDFRQSNIDESRYAWTV